ncbi:MAG: N-6 DNA methylase [Akkermansiaceae bacterium]|nr:N-6 DNA methylase [Akkermansiaceae bacterium]
MKNTEQVDLFGEVETAGISIDESARRLRVSTATIRNWLKTGYLTSAGCGQITEASLSHFQEQVLGTEKLNQRANKSSKDTHDHETLAIRFINRAQSDSSIINHLGDDYESCLSDSYRNKEGIYYTPSNIVCDLFFIPKEKIKNATFCDPCCGSGNFIIRALELGFKPENVFGFDVDPVAVEITKARIRQFCGYESSNIIVKDFLTVASNGSAQRFDHIYTNPPWGKKLTKEEKEFFGARFRTGSSVDTCSLFFFACLACLSSGGTLGLLLPESFFNISTFEHARLKALSLNVNRMVDYDKAFKGLLTKAQAIILTNKPREQHDIVKCDKAGDSTQRSVRSFLSNPKAILNLHCDHESAATLDYLFSIPHIRLAEQASWGLGIVTGNNEKFVVSAAQEGYIPVFKGSDISQNELKKPSSYIPSDLSQYQQVAPLTLYQAQEKLIYKFISSRLCFFCDTEQRFLLNSANILIPYEDFPVSTKILGQLLSSDFMNWIFTSIFNTHKVLRGDIESLPIFSQFLGDAIRFDEDKYLEQLHIKKTNNGTYRIKS